MLPPNLTRFRSSLACLLLTLAAAPGLAADAARTDVHGDPLPDGAVARLGNSGLSHRGNIEWAAFSPEGKTLATRTRVTGAW